MVVLRATRWQELCDTLISLSEISTSLGARTDFHLLNPGTSSATPPGGGQYLSLCTDAYGFVTAAGATVDHDQLSAFFKGLSPTGTTPLAESLHQIINTINPVAEKMRHNGQKAVVVIATDGLPNDKNAFLRALQQLQALPVFPIVRLCTNDDNVVQYYSDLDKSLEHPLEVLDDEAGEAQEIRAVNPWLTYGQPLHLAREFGLHDKLYDILDEQPLLPSQAKQLIERLWGAPAPGAGARAGRVRRRGRARARVAAEGVRPEHEPEGQLGEARDAQAHAESGRRRRVQRDVSERRRDTVKYSV